MFHHSTLPISKQDPIDLQQSCLNSNPSNNDNIIYGVEIPNRVFVGGVAYDTTELELKNFFQSFGEIKDAKIITDRDGISKGYGFITFEKEEQAIKMQEKKTIYYKEKKLNIGPAIRKQGGQFPKANQEFLTGQIKIFINSSHSPVYTPSCGDKLSPMVYSLSPSHYVPTLPYCHHTDSTSRLSATPRQQIIPMTQNEPTHFLYPFPPSISSQPTSQKIPSHFDQVKMFSPDHTPAHTPPPLHSLQPFHFPRYPIILPPEQFFSPLDHSDTPSTAWYKMTESNSSFTNCTFQNKIRNQSPVSYHNIIQRTTDSKQYMENKKLPEKNHFSQLGSAFNKLSINKHEIEPTGQLTPPLSPENK